MSDNWQPGDVALCVDDRNYSPPHNLWGQISPIRVGEKYTVTRVFFSSIPHFMVGGVLGVGLSLELLEIKNTASPERAFDARRFIKQPSLVVEDRELVEAKA